MSNSLKLNSNDEQQNENETTRLEIKDVKTSILPNSSTKTNLTDIVETLQIENKQVIVNNGQLNGDNYGIESKHNNNQELEIPVLIKKTDNLEENWSNNDDKKNNEEIDENKLKEMCEAFNSDATPVIRNLN